MPFRESRPMEERIALMKEYDSGAFTVSDLCARYEISRETFYVWKRRREAGGERWFEEQSRAPSACPHTTPKEVVSAILEIRGRFPRFGPKEDPRAFGHGKAEAGFARGLDDRWHFKTRGPYYTGFPGGVRLSRERLSRMRMNRMMSGQWTLKVGSEHVMGYALIR